MINKNKTEFSKKIFNIVITLFIIVLLYSMALMWKTDNTDALAYLIPSVSGLSATCVGFYYWKARLENKIKLSKEYDVPIEEVDEFDEQIENEKIESEEC